MVVKHAATAGTLESSDAMVTIEPAAAGIDIFIESPVIHHFGKQIRRIALAEMNGLGIENVKLTIVDKGALDCTLRARIECAAYRAADMVQDSIPWGGGI